MKYLFFVHASNGHVLSAVKLAHSLIKRGHDVRFLVAQEYLITLQMYGIEAVGVTNQPNMFNASNDWFEKGPCLDQIRLLETAIEDYQPDTLVTNPLAISAFIVAEKHELRTMVLGYCEYLYPVLNTQRTVKHWRMESITKHYNDLRSELGMAPVTPDAGTSPLIGDVHLLRSTHEFNGNEAVPDQVMPVGPLYMEPTYTYPALDKFIDAHRDEGRRVLYIQVGRLFDHADVFHNMIETLIDQDIAAVVDLGRCDYDTKTLEDSDLFFTAPFIPVGHVADRIDTVVCSTQTTSVVGAISNGMQLICTPYSADSRELAQRVAIQGVGADTCQEGTFVRQKFLTALEDTAKGRFMDRVNHFRERFAALETEALEKVA